MAKVMVETATGGFSLRVGDSPPTRISSDDLSSVLETKDPNLLHETQLAEQNYHACAQALQIRNQELQKFYENPRVSHHIRGD